MIEQFIALYPTGKIRYQQTSFIELITEVEVHKIDFIGKAAATIRRGTGGELSYSTTHPVLQYFNGPMTSVAIRALSEVPTAFFVDYEQCVARLTHGWRHLAPTWSNLGIGVMQRTVQCLPRHISLGFQFPEFIAQEIIGVLQQYNLEVRCEPRGHQTPKPISATPPFSLLFIGSNHIIARDFRVSTLY